MIQRPTRTDDDDDDDDDDTNIFIRNLSWMAWSVVLLLIPLWPPPDRLEDRETIVEIKNPGST